jgi:hypothetical protein
LHPWRYKTVGLQPFGARSLSCLLLGLYSSGGEIRDVGLFANPAINLPSRDKDMTTSGQSVEFAAFQPTAH